MTHPAQTPTHTASQSVGLAHLDHLNMSVASLAASKDWYGRLFDFQQVEEGLYEGKPWAILRSGEAMLCLYEHASRTLPDKDERARLGLHGLSHFALRITDPDAWEARVAEQGVEVHYGGVFRWPNSRAWYVSDPTGYTIEVVHWNDDTVRFG